MLVLKIMLVLLTSATASLGNTLLKTGASSGQELLELHHLPRAFLRPTILAGVAAYGASQLLWITLLRVIDLSLAYPLQVGLNFILIMLVAWSWFKEPISLGKIAGAALIFGGIVMVTAG
jgi:multidrug transporter EmrE-like cation transporter